MKKLIQTHIVLEATHTYGIELMESGGTRYKSNDTIEDVRQ